MDWNAVGHVHWWSYWLKITAMLLMLETQGLSSVHKEENLHLISVETIDLLTARNSKGSFKKEARYIAQK